MGVFQNSVFFGVLVSLASYGIGMAVKRKTGWSLANPLLISIILVICVLLLTGVSYTTYSAGANSISYLLTPATICLAVPLYQQVELLKKNYHAVTAAGVGLLQTFGDYQVQVGDVIPKGYVFTYDVSQNSDFKGKIEEIKPTSDLFAMVLDARAIRYKRYTKGMLKQPFYNGI